MKTVDYGNGNIRKRLETWGEIATNLGVEIRTAQRWEARLGLPIRRLEGSQAVFAFADEIEQWRASREVGRSTTEAATDNAGEATSGTIAPPALSNTPADAVRDTRERFLATTRILVLVAITAIVTLAIARLVPYSTAGGPAKLVIQGDRLDALDSSGRVLWSHDLQEPASPIDTVFRPEFQSWWERIDADSDGQEEVIAFISHVKRNVRVETLLWFSLAGELLYSWTPELGLSFERERFSGPWRFWDIEPVAEDGSLWVAIEDEGWWPSAVIRIARDRTTSIRFVQPGLIRLLRSHHDGGQTVILAGGVNNEYGAASLAVIDPEGPPATSPQKGAGPYTCLECPQGLPLRYFLFSPSPLNVAEGLPYNQTQRLVITSARVDVGTYETDRAIVWYHLSHGLEPQSAAPSDGYWTSKPHDLNWRGSIGHPSLIRVRKWESGVWSAEEIPFAVKSQ